MKTAVSIAVLAVLLVAPSPCFALGWIMPVSKEEAKQMGLEVRSEWAGPNDVRVELELKADGGLKNFSGVDLWIGEGDKPQVAAPLREDRSKPGRIVVSFTADRAQLDKITLRVMVVELGLGVYQLRIKDFVEPGKGRWGAAESGAADITGNVSVLLNWACHCRRAGLQQLCSNQWASRDVGGHPGARSSTAPRAPNAREHVVRVRRNPTRT
jgi:hypothetical protein